MTTVISSPASIADNGTASQNFSESYNGYSSNSLLIGFWNGLSNHAFIRFVLNAPKDVVVSSATVSAYLSAVIGTAGTPPATATVTAAAANDAAAPTSYAEFKALPLTTSSVAWSTTRAAIGSVITSPDLSAVVQEVVNRAAWASGNHIVVVARVPTSAGNDNRWTLNPYGTSPIPVLSVTYVDAGPETHTGSGTALAVTAGLNPGSGSKKATNLGASVTALTSLAVGTGTAVHPFAPSATVQDGNVTLTWDSRPGATGYAVERDGAVVAFDISALTYVDTPGEGEHTYRVGVLL